MKTVFQATARWPLFPNAPRSRRVTQTAPQFKGEWIALPSSE